MSQPPGSSDEGFGDPSPEEPAPAPQQWATPPAPQPGYYQPTGYPPPPGQYQQPAPYPGAPPQHWGPPVAGLSPQEERTWAMFAHIGSIIAAFLALAFLGPLVVLLTQGAKSAFVRRHAVESLNFQLTLLIAVVVGVIGSLVTLGLGLLIFIPLLIVGGIAALVFTVMGAVKANNGEEYRYPINIRMVK
jgi:uncharacterized Tic20 family protein